MAHQFDNYVVKIEITAFSKVKERSGISEKTGKEWYIKTQEGYAHIGKTYPIEIQIPLEKEQKPYLEGFYYISPSIL